MILNFFLLMSYIISSKLRAYNKVKLQASFKKIARHRYQYNGSWISLFLVCKFQIFLSIKLKAGKKVNLPVQLDGKATMLYESCFVLYKYLEMRGLWFHANVHVLHGSCSVYVLDTCTIVYSQVCKRSLPVTVTCSLSL